MEIEKKTKAQLRERMKRRRDAIPEAERASRSEAIAKCLTEADWYALSKMILVYAAIRSEASLGTFCAMAWQDGKCLYFPRVTGEKMEFYRADAPDQLAQGAFHILEPTCLSQAFAGSPEPVKKSNNGNGAGYVDGSTGERVPILVPGVAFSKTGARIGYGKGYYDRYLAGKPKLLPVGICFEEQLVDAIETEVQDYPMRQIVTERKVYVIDE